MARSRYLIALIAIIFLSGCGTTAILERDAKGPTADETVVVIGIKSPDYRIMFFPGELSHGGFRQDPMRGAVVNGIPRDGYIVARAKAGQILGLTIVEAPKGERIISGKTYTACGGTRTLVFEVPKAKVVYLADIAYEPTAERLSVSYQARLGTAQEHLRNNYPGIREEVTQHEFQILAATYPCARSTIVIPIYLGR